MCVVVVVVVVSIYKGMMQTNTKLL